MRYDWIGWLATAVFMTSYLSKSPIVLRRIQACASCLWLAYGITIHSVPMIVANALVAGVALYSSFASKPVGQSVSQVIQIEATSAKSNRPV